MRTLAKTAIALSFIGATGSTAAVQAQGVYYGYGPHPYYHHYRHWRKGLASAFVIRWPVWPSGPRRE
jgi:hypothetical protein